MAVAPSTLFPSIVNGRFSEWGEIRLSEDSRERFPPSVIFRRRDKKMRIEFLGFVNPWLGLTFLGDFGLAWCCEGRDLHATYTSDS